MFLSCFVCLYYVVGVCSTVYCGPVYQHDICVIRVRVMFPCIDNLLATPSVERRKNE